MVELFTTENSPAGTCNAKKSRSREEASRLTGLKRFSCLKQGKEEGSLKKKDSPARLPQQAVDDSHYNSAGP